jgi:shikimate dehydrogenase
MIITGTAKLAGVIGWPVRHSLSPQLHGYWLDVHKIDGALVPLCVRREDFAIVVKALLRAGFSGTNVTVPHKEAAFALADFCDVGAKNAGAANLLVFHADGRIEGRNTDVFGLAASLRDGLGAETLKGKAAVLLGAGGAARAAILALGELGAGEIRILNRSPDRAESLAKALTNQVSAKLTAGPLTSWPQAAKDSGLLLNATSTGMENRNPLDLALDALPATAAVCDIVYNPLETDLLKRAKASGHVTIDGLGMLMHQAAPAFGAFFRIEPEVTPALRRMLEKVLLHG